MRTPIIGALVLAASVANAAPVYLSCSGDWSEDEKLLVHDTFSLVVDPNNGTVTHQGWTLKIYNDEAGEILASAGGGRNWRFVHLDRVTGEVHVSVPFREHSGGFGGTCSSLTLNDTVRILTFQQKLISFGKNDLLVTTSSAASANAAQCLANLNDNLTIVLGGFAVVSDLAKLVPLMVNPDDEAVLVSELRENIKNFQQALANNRNSVNGFIGICGPSGVVAVKGQELLRLYDEAAALVEIISNKIGR